MDRWYCYKDFFLTQSYWTINYTIWSCVLQLLYYLVIVGLPSLSTVGTFISSLHHCMCTASHLSLPCCHLFLYLLHIKKSQLILVQHHFQHIFYLLHHSLLLFSPCVVGSWFVATSSFNFIYSFCVLHFSLSGSHQQSLGSFWCLLVDLSSGRKGFF